MGRVAEVMFPIRSKVQCPRISPLRHCRAQFEHAIRFLPELKAGLVEFLHFPIQLIELRLPILTTGTCVRSRPTA